MRKVVKGGFQSLLAEAFGRFDLIRFISTFKQLVIKPKTGKESFTKKKKLALLLHSDPI